jgi:hypothetical protein
MGAVGIVIFTFLVPNKQKLVVIEASEEVDARGNTVPEKMDVPNDIEQAGSEKRDGMAGRVVEENAPAEELKPIEGEEYGAEEALTPEEVKSQKTLAWSTLITGTLVFMIVSLFIFHDSSA